MRYVLRLRLVENTPIQLMQRTTAVWTQTAIQNGAKSTIVCRNLNATWTGNEDGGQSIQKRWAGDFRFQNRLQTLAEKKHLFI